MAYQINKNIDLLLGTDKDAVGIGPVLGVLLLDASNVIVFIMEQ